MPLRAIWSRAAAATLGAALLAAAACGGPPTPRASPGATVQAVPDTFTATIEEVRLSARVLEVITGRGFALRVLKVRVPPDVRIVWAGQSVPLTAMRPGYVVHISCHHTESGLVAERIEEVGYPPYPPRGEAPPDGRRR